jgi:hypothetical protein
MEKLINSIPKTKSFGKDKNGEEMLSGICLKYQAKIGKWLCGYGSRVNSDFAVSAHDPIEALADFVELLKKKKNE